MCLNLEPLPPPPPTGRNWTGYRSLCAALCRAKEDLHLPVHKPSFYGSITMETMKQIFRSDSSEELPLLKERMTNLHQAARVLNKVCGVCGCVGGVSVRVWVWDVGRSSYDLSKLALKTDPFQKRKPHL